MSKSKVYEKGISKSEKTLADKKAELNSLAKEVERDGKVGYLWSPDLECRHRKYLNLLKEVQELEDKQKQIISTSKQTSLKTFFGT